MSLSATVWGLFISVVSICKSHALGNDSTAGICFTANADVNTTFLEVALYKSELDNKASFALFSVLVLDSRHLSLL